MSISITHTSHTHIYTYIYTFCTVFRASILFVGGIIESKGETLHQYWTIEIQNPIQNDYFQQFF